MSARLSAGVVVVRHARDAWLFLMLRAYRNWDFPKGLVEAGEEPLAAARREVREETLLEELQFTWGEIFRETAPYSHKKVARYYIAQTTTEAVTLPINPQLGRPEHNEWRWVSFEQGLALCSPRLDPIMRWAGDTLGCTGPAPVPR
ncbi:MAG TPA: NUDIX domain-containing protein [Steroidobacteraceae bacterium]|jgi:8-oxo-dGTP pyrophosphatase MutT (NUDIX family)